MTDTHLGVPGRGDQSGPAAGLPAGGSDVPRAATDGQASPRPPVRHGATGVLVALWSLAFLVTAVLIHQRYRGAVSGSIGADFGIYLHAAHLVAAGHSPYQGNGAFVYPPVLALLLAPFVHAAPNHVFRVWTVLELSAVLAGIGAFVAMESSRLRAWLRPILFIVCAVTVFHFWPLTVGLFLGQADAFVFAAVMMSAWAATRDRPATRGVLIGVAGLLKTWPAAVIVSMCQKGAERRLRAVAAFVVTILIAPVLAVAFGGGSGLVDFVQSVISARSQHLVSDSVWGAPSLLFSNSGLAHPIVVSAPLQFMSTAALLIWVVGLVVVALRTSGDTVMCTWNVTFCIVLLLPVSHLAYTLYCLPVLWLWTCRILESRNLTWGQLTVPVVLLLWWVVQTKAWPDSGSSPAIGAAHYCVVFGADLVACSASVIGARYLRPRGRHESDRFLSSPVLVATPS
jgi:alpha-1,2-mannosyltransferase